MGRAGYDVHDIDHEFLRAQPGMLRGHDVADLDRPRQLRGQREQGAPVAINRALARQGFQLLAKGLIDFSHKDRANAPLHEPFNRPAGRAHDDDIGGPDPRLDFFRVVTEENKTARFLGRKGYTLANPFQRQRGGEVVEIEQHSKEVLDIEAEKVLVLRQAIAEDAKEAVLFIDHRNKTELMFLHRVHRLAEVTANGHGVGLSGGPHQLAHGVA